MKCQSFFIIRKRLTFLSWFFPSFYPVTAFQYSKPRHTVLLIASPSFFFKKCSSILSALRKKLLPAANNLVGALGISLPNIKRSVLVSLATCIPTLNCMSVCIFFLYIKCLHFRRWLYSHRTHGKGILTLKQQRPNPHPTGQGSVRWYSFK